MFTVAIIGRPNVGKSTLYNRLTGTRHALVDDTPGVTRDRRIGQGHIGPMQFSIIDTAGLEEAPSAQLEARMFKQTEQAVEEADISLFVVDARSGLTPLDKHFGQWLRKKGRPVILVVNKCEGNVALNTLGEMIRLGLGEPTCISAEHGEGMGDLYEALEPHHDAYMTEFGELDVDLMQAAEDGDTTKALQIAIVGRPNAGKSTLLNALIGQDRVLTGPEAGITRDSIAIDWVFQGQAIRLIDTAGIRRQAKVSSKLERLSLSDCFRAARYAHVCILLVDGTQPLEKQDIAIADMMLSEGRSVVIGVNKWDLVEDKDATMRLIRERAEQSLPQVKGIPIVTLSALYNNNLSKLISTAIGIYGLWNQRIPTAKLNEWVKWAEERHMAPIGSHGRRIRLKYITQGNTRPPTFTLFSNKPEDLPKSYVRYLVNLLRDSFNLPGVPIRLMLRKSENPYDGKRKPLNRAKKNPKSTNN
ncbi:MAG: ribosome biosis GTPase Der [Rickettsiales bacterium]|jgi:GTP-binding protein|nr:ribosome biosis GTPase Der [Rickettsiales bacterium]